MKRIIIFLIIIGLCTRLYSSQDHLQEPFRGARDNLKQIINEIVAHLHEEPLPLFTTPFISLSEEVQEYIIDHLPISAKNYINKPLANRIGRTRLHEATTFLEIRILISCGIDYDHKDDLGNTAFNNFIQQGNLDLATYLLKLKPSLNVWSGNYFGIYPLHTVIRFGNIKLAQRIIQAIKKQFSAQDASYYLTMPEQLIIQDHRSRAKIIIQRPLELAHKAHMAEIISLLSSP